MGGGRAAPHRGHSVVAIYSIVSLLPLLAAYPEHSIVGAASVTILKSNAARVVRRPIGAAVRGGDGAATVRQRRMKRREGDEAVAIAAACSVMHVLLGIPLFCPLLGIVLLPLLPVLPLPLLLLLLLLLGVVVLRGAVVVGRRVDALS